MTEIEEGDLKFSFPDHCQADKYDEWSFYRNQFQSVAGGSKAVDILCLSDDATWLIEIKDYRKNPRLKLIDIGDEVAGKVRDTLAGLAAAGWSARFGQFPEGGPTARVRRAPRQRVAVGRCLRFGDPAHYGTTGRGARGRDLQNLHRTQTARVPRFGETLEGATQRRLARGAGRDAMTDVPRTPAEWRQQYAEENNQISNRLTVGEFDDRAAIASAQRRASAPGVAPEPRSRPAHARIRAGATTAH